MTVAHVVPWMLAVTSGQGKARALSKGEGDSIIAIPRFFIRPSSLEESGKSGTFGPSPKSWMSQIYLWVKWKEKNYFFDELGVFSFAFF